MKSYTSLEQSKKLAEILSLESADMHWQYIEEDNGQLQWFCFPKDFSINQHDNIRAWSLTALLDYLSSNFRVDIKYLDKHWELDCRVQVTYGKELVDACYEMIIRLNEQKLI